MSQDVKHDQQEYGKEVQQDIKKEVMLVMTMYTE